MNITAFVSKVTDRLDPRRFNIYLERLPRHERNKIARFRQWQDAHLSLFGKLLLIEALKRNGLGPHTILTMEKTKYHKPFFTDGPEFNISHAGSYAVCVMAREKIGVDIEHIRPIQMEDFRSQWTSEEWNGIVESENPLHRFYTYWTRKEAVIKADGRAMYLPLREINTVNTPVVVDDCNWFISDVRVDQQYCCCIATQQMQVHPIESELFFFN